MKFNRRIILINKKVIKYNSEGQNDCHVDSQERTHSKRPIYIYIKRFYMNNGKIIVFQLNPETS